MKPSIKNLQDSYAISRDIFKKSDEEAQIVVDMYHNRQYTQEEIDTLVSRGQPIETFNIIKMFSNAVEGYLESTVHDIQITPRYASNQSAALLLNDVVQYILETNEFDNEGSKAILDGILTGKMCVFYDIVDKAKSDEFGRAIKEVKIEYVPAHRVRIDPMSERDDSSDARFWHMWKWIDEEEFKRRWGSKLKKAESYSSSGTDDEFTDFENKYGMRLTGKFRQWNNYLVVHSIVRDGDITWSIIWHNDTILEKKKVPYEKVLSPIRVVLMSRSDRAEHYGIFRDIIESQKAINQAVIQIQLLVNTKKAFIQSSAVDSIDEFRDAFMRVNDIVELNDINGYRIEDLSREVQQQYLIIDRALSRIQQVLGINNSFLGTTFAADSGRKVNLQQAASASQMTPIVKRIKLFYKLVGEDIVHFVQQYYTAHQVLRLSDKLNGDNYLELNKPLLMPNIQGIPSPVYDEEIGPDGMPLEDKEGNILMTPLNDPDTDLQFMDVDIKVVAVAHNNAKEQNQLLFETFLNGPTGQAVLQTNPAGYYKIAGMNISEMGTKNAPQIAKVLLETGQLVSKGQMDPSLAMTGGNTQAILGGAMGGSNNGGPKSKQLQIPQGGN